MIVGGHTVMRILPLVLSPLLRGLQVPERLGRSAWVASPILECPQPNVRFHPMTGHATWFMETGAGENTFHVVMSWSRHYVIELIQLL